MFLELRTLHASSEAEQVEGRGEFGEEQEWNGDLGFGPPEIIYVAKTQATPRVCLLSCEIERLG